MLMTIYSPEEEGPNKWVAWEAWNMCLYGTGETEDEAIEDYQRQLEFHQCRK